MKEKTAIIPFERIATAIHLIHGQKVMLSTDLAALYGVKPKVLMQAVRRNIKRFPADFMFQLAPQEFANLKSQIVTSSWGGFRQWLADTSCESAPAALRLGFPSDEGWLYQSRL